MRELERAVYALLEHGPISATVAALYAGGLAHLLAARLVRRTHEGGYELASRDTRGAMVTFTASVPQECVDFLDSLGPTRDEALLAVLRRWSGSGTRRKA